MPRRGFRKWEKAPGNPVTETDLAVDRLLSKRLQRPRVRLYGWLSEEREDDQARLGCERTFLVDPIDGTRDFVRGRPGWCVSIAVVEAGQPTAAVLFAPATDVLYHRHERRRSGTRRRKAGGLPGRTDVDGRPPARGCRPAALALLDRPGLHARSPKPNSIALRLALIAAGEADALFDGRSSRELDIAAATLIVTEAGGHVCDTDGNRAPLQQARAEGTESRCCRHARPAGRKPATPPMTRSPAGAPRVASGKGPPAPPNKTLVVLNSFRHPAATRLQAGLQLQRRSAGP